MTTRKTEQPAGAEEIVIERYCIDADGHMHAEPGGRAAAADSETGGPQIESGSTPAPGYAPQRWTAEQPAVAGWWWLRRATQDACGRPAWTPGRIVLVQDDWEGLFYLNHLGSISISAVIRIKTLCGEWAEWSGPLPEPVDAPDAETGHIDQVHRPDSAEPVVNKVARK